MTIADVLARYEARIGELHIVIGQTRLQGAIAFYVLAAAVAALLTLSGFAFRQQVAV